MLRVEVKEGLLLTFFALFMHEVLTPVTIAVALAGLLALIFCYRPPRLLRNVLALGILGSYWISYGKVIDPEVGLNFLTTVILLKLLEKDAERDQYMIFFGLLLVLSAGSLFERTLTYMLFFSAAFIVLLRDFYSRLGRSAGVREIGLLFLWVFPLTMALFLFVPRIMNPIPFKRAQGGQGEIGYTRNVNPSQLEELKGNPSPAFHALVERQLSQEDLYWRGNTLSESDGWNWNPSSRDGQEIVAQELIAGADELVQNIRLFIREDNLFSIDSPVSLSYRDETYVVKGNRTLEQKRRGWVQRYQVISRPGRVFLSEDNDKGLLRTALNAEEMDWIRKTFRAREPGPLEEEIRKYFHEKGFVYSFKPGRVIDFGEFMREKKVGFCSHYASAVALIMRAHNIPARLVSGYMGGSYNPFGQFYLVSQNDAHVWVEVKTNGLWRRIDPTGWIAPDRVRLGGEAYMSAATSQGITNFRFPGFTALKNLQLWFTQWDFRFYRWLEEVDYYGQEAWLMRFNFKRAWFYTLAPLLLLLFTAFYAWQLRKRKRGRRPSELEVCWRQFLNKLKKRGIDLPLNSVKEAGLYLEKIEHPEREKIVELWELLIQESYAMRPASENLARKMKEL